MDDHDDISLESTLYDSYLYLCPWLGLGVERDRVSRVVVQIGKSRLECIPRQLQLLSGLFVY